MMWYVMSLGGLLLFCACALILWMYPDPKPVGWVDYERKAFGETILVVKFSDGRLRAFKGQRALWTTYPGHVEVLNPRMVAWLERQWRQLESSQHV